MQSCNESVLILSFQRADPLLYLEISRSFLFEHTNLNWIKFAEVYPINKNMPLLRTTKRFLTIVGIKPLPEKYFPSILRNFQMVFNVFHIIFALTTIVTFAISIMCFLMFEAISFTQFSEAGLFYMVAYLHASFYTISIVKRSKIFSFMQRLETIIEKSMMNHYNEKYKIKKKKSLKFNQDI